MRKSEGQKKRGKPNPARINPNMARFYRMSENPLCMAFKYINKKGL